MNQRDIRKLHRVIAPLIFLPYLLTTITGVYFILGHSWFKMPDKLSQIMMGIHTGGFLGEELAPVYTLLNGLGAIAMLITGIYLSRMFVSRRVEKKPAADKRSRV